MAERLFKIVSDFKPTGDQPEAIDAIVNVLPLPVTPWRTRLSSPRLRPSYSAATASGWSPVGLNLDFSLNGLSMAVVPGAGLEPARQILGKGF